MVLPGKWARGCQLQKATCNRITSGPTKLFFSSWLLQSTIVEGKERHNSLSSQSFTLRWSPGLRDATLSDFFTVVLSTRGRRDSTQVRDGLESYQQQAIKQERCLGCLTTAV